MLKRLYQIGEMFDLWRGTAKLRQNRGSFIAPFSLRGLQPCVGAVAGRNVPLLAPQSSLAAGECRVDLERTCCPWCCRGIDRPTHVEWCEVLVCPYCAGSWALLDVPSMGRPAKVVRQIATGGTDGETQAQG